MNDAHTISSNHFSTDQQASDALDYLRANDSEAYTTIKREFPENIVWSGGWFDTEAMGVDDEWGSWLIDAIEQHSTVSWWEGEPWSEYPDTDEDEDDNATRARVLEDVFYVMERRGEADQ